MHLMTGGQTWPPGPELREKAILSTAALGMGHSRKRFNQSRAAATSFEVARFERGGGAGSDVAEHWFVRCRAVRMSSLKGPVRTSSTINFERVRSM
jgi:hypothetical protein